SRRLKKCYADARPSLDEGIGTVSKGAELNASDIFQSHRGTVRCRFENNVFIVRVLRKFALVFQDVFKRSAAALPESSGCCFQVLIADCVQYVCWRKIVCSKSVRIKPYPH